MASSPMPKRTARLDTLASTRPKTYSSSRTAMAAMEPDTTHRTGISEVFHSGMPAAWVIRKPLYTVAPKPSRAYAAR